MMPLIECPKEMETTESRMIKLGIVKGKTKKECRVPFKLCNNMRMGITTEVIGLEDELTPILEVKPKSMTLTGKGQFSLCFSANMAENVRKELENNQSMVVRRILIMKIKDTNFMYHYPI